MLKGPIRRRGRREKTEKAHLRLPGEDTLLQLGPPSLGHRISTVFRHGQQDQTLTSGKCNFIDLLRRQVNGRSVNRSQWMVAQIQAPDRTRH